MSDTGILAAGPNSKTVRVNTENLGCPIWVYAELIKSPYIDHMLSTKMLYGEFNFRYNSIASYLTISPHNLAYRIDTLYIKDDALYMDISEVGAYPSMHLFEQELVSQDTMVFTPRVLFNERDVKKSRLITVDCLLKNDYTCLYRYSGEK